MIQVISLEGSEKQFQRIVWCVAPLIWFKENMRARFFTLLPSLDTVLFYISQKSCVAAVIVCVLFNSTFL